MVLRVSGTLRALPKVRTQRSQSISGDLEEDRDFSPEDGGFVSVELEIARIKVTRSATALVGEVHNVQRVGGTGCDPVW